VDDRSTDDTNNVLVDYIKKDNRFQYHSRPANRPKGANASRNYGFECSRGSYVIWFDSDDIMTKNHITLKISAINDNNVDFVITKTKYLNSDVVDEYYDFRSEDISCHNYIVQKVNWLTYDVLIKRSLAEKIRFNENLQSGQEFNYFAKMTNLSNSACLLDEYVTLRRYHSESIRGPLRADSNLLLKSIFIAHWLTYLDLYTSIEKKTRKYLIKKCIVDYFNINNYYRLFSFNFFLAIEREFGLKKALFYSLSSLTNLCFGKGYYFAKKARNLNI
jgi:glycosyltransferase involved in cell wall biosynthesis